MTRVTLHVSVWVEIHTDCNTRRQILSRSTWACELKYAETHDTVLRLCHAPRERVSWNLLCVRACALSDVTLHVSVWVEIFSILWRLSYFTSRSTWACELKSFVKIRWRIAVLSRSTWACELKLFHHLCYAVCSGGHAPRERVSWNLF